MSKWITGKDLIAYWGIKDFELFGYLKKGLQPYTQYGHKIIDTDTLEQGRKFSLEFFEGTIRHEQNMKVISSRSYRSSLSDQEIKQQARKSYEGQRFEPITPPSHHMSFTIPSDEKRSRAAIGRLLGLNFKKDETSEFAEKNALIRLNSSNEIPVVHKEKREELPPPSSTIPHKPDPTEKEATDSQHHGNTFILKGEYWSIRYKGSDEVNIKNLERIRYIVHLIEQPLPCLCLN